MPKINREALGECWVWFPELREQDRIIEWVDAALQPLDEVANRIQREIALLREYRTRLIADVVTGKLDVRAAAELPDGEPDGLMIDNAAENAETDDDADGVIEETDA